MKHVSLLFLSLLFSLSSFAQRDYFQQKVDYKISVVLDDQNHTLSGFETLTYFNNSPDTLEFIYIHLWPNAYQSTHSALGKQMLEDANLNLHFSYEKDKGYIDSLSFTSRGKPLKMTYNEQHRDIAILKLNTPLLPKSNVIISTPFKVKFPNSNISRLGHVGESYQVTQWFPKPAVYDRNGWHPMPYLNQGEFYSEFGSFDVEITLPKNYVVGSTGDLINGENELKWLEEIHQKTLAKYSSEYRNSRSMEFPISSKETKTLRYSQKNIHDFAWFADKRYNVLKDTIRFPKTGRVVDTWLMFTDNEQELWKDAIPYIKDAIYYYSKWNGDYPYNQVTAVDGTISAGGGMEYPNVTIIGESGTDYALEQVIVHEVGHNWFYGVLGSNERKNAWMDEGLNSFNENRYFYTKYPGSKLLNLSSGLSKKFGIDEYPARYLSDISYLIPASYNADQPIQFSSEEYSSLNYGGIVYSKTAIMFDYLKEYLGENVFDAAMKSYYADWEFKHPEPKDVQLALESTSGQDLSWFFDDMLKSSKKIDYKISKTKRKSGLTRVIIKNNGGLTAPISVTAFGKNDTLNTLWSSSIKDRDTLTFNRTDVKYFLINGTKKIPELNNFNNYSRSKGLFKRIEPLKLQLLGGLDNPGKSLIYFSPIAGWNNYDQMMLGMAFYNHLAIKKPFEYTLAPMYSFGRKTLTGLANVEYTFHPEKTVRNFSLGLNTSRFGTYKDENLKSNYTKITPYLSTEFQPRNARTSAKKTLTSHLHLVQNQYTGENFNLFENVVVSSISFKLVSKQVLKPKSLNVNFQYGILNNGVSNDFSRLSVTGKYRHNYDKNLNGISFRGFIGSYLFNNVNDRRFRFYEGGDNGGSDVAYNNIFLGRNEDHPNILSQQMVFNQSGLRAPTPFSSSKWLAGINTDIDIPLMLPFNFYFDVSFFPYTLSSCTSAGCTTSNKISANFVGGLSFKVIKNVFEIYVPLVVNSELKDIYEYQNINFLQRIRFTFQFSQLNPFKLIEKNIN